jgi:hypothetical protein
MFARWWADQLEANPSRVLLPGRSLSAIAPNEASYCTIRTAINARRIMVNDIAGFSNDSQYLPWMMWWPLKPYKSATRLGRQMCIHAPHIALTCVMPDYESTYRALKPAPAPTKSLANCLAK